MNFEISCETYVRLSAILRHFPDNVDAETRKILNCIRIERRGGITVALASNRKIAAIEHCGDSSEADGVAHLIIDDAMIAQCKTETPFNSTITVTTLPELSIGSAKTSLGYNYPGNSCIFPVSTPLDGWRKWHPSEPITASVGAMCWTTDDIQAINASSPSGVICFPEFIDANKPVVLRDLHAPEWVGMFMPNRIDDKGKVYSVTPAEFPTWCR